MAAAGRALVYGGKGALGSLVVSHFKSKNWVRRWGADLHRGLSVYPLSSPLLSSSSTLQWVASIDLFANEEAAANVVLQNTESWTAQGTEVGGAMGGVIIPPPLYLFLDPSLPSFDCSWRRRWEPS